MSRTIREIPINPNLSAQRCREMISRVETVRQGAIAEAWLTANRTISWEESAELMQALTLRIREAFRREAAEGGTGARAASAGTDSQSRAGTTRHRRRKAGT